MFTFSHHCHKNPTLNTEERYNVKSTRRVSYLNILRFVNHLKEIRSRSFDMFLRYNSSYFGVKNKKCETNMKKRG